MDQAPYYLDVAGGPQDAQAFWLNADDGMRLRAALWRAEGAPRGLVLLFPGRTEYVEKYALTAGALAARGYATLSIDWRGQGLTERPLADTATGHVRRFGDYQRDVRALTDAATRLGLGGPWHLLAHSMGGCIGLRALGQGLAVRTAAFSAPMWGIRISPSLRPLAWTLASASRVTFQGHRYAPSTSPVNYALSFPFDGNMLSSDAGMYALMRDQMIRHPDLALGGPSLHWLHEALLETRALARLPSPALPAYCGLGGAERVVDVPAVHARMARWPGARFDIFDGAEHELLMERPAVRESFLARVIEMFDAA